jgi:hypothetical protein
MKAEAYTCDFCGELKFSAEVVGISLEQDLFEKMKSFQTNPHAHRCHCHLCTKCYDMNVVQVANRDSNRKKDENSYRLKLEEMSYMVRAQCVANYWKKATKKVAGSR